MGVSEGELPLRSWKKMQFINSICKIWCISFANILLKNHNLFFSNEILAIITSIPPTFPFFFYDIGYYHVYSSNGVQGIVPLFHKKYIKWGKNA